MTDSELWEELKKLQKKKVEQEITFNYRARKRSPGEQCRGKYVFQSPKHAKKTLKHSHAFRARVYYCTSCGGWHLSNRDKDINV